MTEDELDVATNTFIFEQELCTSSHRLGHGGLEGEMKFRPVTTSVELKCYENEVTNLIKFGLPTRQKTDEAMPWTKKAKLSK